MVRVYMEKMKCVRLAYDSWRVFLFLWLRKYFLFSQTNIITRFLDE